MIHKTFLLRKNYHRLQLYLFLLRLFHLENICRGHLVFILFSLNCCHMKCKLGQLFSFFIKKKCLSLIKRTKKKTLKKASISIIVCLFVVLKILVPCIWMLLSYLQLFCIALFTNGLSMHVLTIHTSESRHDHSLNICYSHIHLHHSFLTFMTT